MSDTNQQHITVTPQAADQIKLSAEQSGINNAVLRIAIKQMQDESFHYAMGFDDAISETDLRFESEGVQLVISPSTEPMSKGMTIDYVELENGENNFIFMNPNDKSYVAPQED